MGPLENSRHEKFCQELAKGRSGVDAYVTAGYNGGNNAISGAARLLTNANIKARVDAIKAKAAEKCELTVADLVKELEHARFLAAGAETPQSSAMVAATMGKAKLLGMVTDKAQVTGPNGGAVQVAVVHDLSNVPDDLLRQWLDAGLVSDED
jgi:hypothetical protein